MDRTLVLRKSVGQFSAGTKVTVTEEHPQTDTSTVEATYTEVEYYTDYAAKKQSKHTPKTVRIEVPRYVITKLRSRTDVVPAIPRSQRPERVARRQLYKMLRGE